MPLLEIIKYLLIGAIQGFTEPLPVSSSAHLIIMSQLLKITTTDLNFEIIVHFASFLAIIAFFRNDLAMLVKGFFNKETRKKTISFTLQLLAASVPAAAAGYFGKAYLDEHFNNVQTAALFLLVTASLLFTTSLLLKRANKLKLTLHDHLTIGFFQMIALAPGLSRSGATLFGGVLCKGEARAVLKFSFFLYLIASMGALVLALKDINWSIVNPRGYLISFISAFIATCIAIRWLYQILSRKSLMVFACYTFLIGLLCLFLI